MRPALRSTALGAAALAILLAGCTGGHKKSEVPAISTAAATSSDSPDLVLPPGQPVSQVALDDTYVGYIHGQGAAQQFNTLTIRSRSAGYPVVLDHTGGYANGGVYNLGIADGWAVWTETSQIVTNNSGDVQWSIVAANLQTKQTRVIRVVNAQTLAPRPVIGDGIIAWAIRGQDNTEVTPGSRPDTLEYVRLDSIATLHTLLPPLQYDPLTLGTSAVGIFLAVLEQDKQGVLLEGFDGVAKTLYSGDLVISDFGTNRFGATDPGQEQSDGSTGTPQNLQVCDLPCAKPTTIVQGSGVSEQELGASIVTFSGDRQTTDATGRTGDITVVTLNGTPIDDLKVGALVYAGWGVSGDTVAWTAPSALPPASRSERIHIRSYSVKK